MSSKAISAACADHYLWGEGCDGWHLLRTPALSNTEERMPPGTAERLHLHSHARQFFYVLSGRLSIEVARESRTLEAHEGLEIAPGVAHQVVDRSGQDVRFLVNSQPPSHGDRTHV